MSGAVNPPSAETIRRYADEVVDLYPRLDLGTLAAEIEGKIGLHDEVGDIARAVAAELRRRAAAGVRKWPKPMH
jgi:hypothetical protein